MMTFVLGCQAPAEHITLVSGQKESITLVAPRGWSGECRMEVDLAAPGAELDLAAMYLGGGADSQSFRIKVNHLSGGCKSRQLFKGVLDGSARAAFDGLIYVAPDAQKTEAYQENHTVLLSAGASVETSPQLEIYADDVQCSHGATSGRLDEDELFYMLSRGIPEAEARRMQIRSFLSPVLSRLEDGDRYLLF